MTTTTSSSTITSITGWRRAVLLGVAAAVVAPVAAAAAAVYLLTEYLLPGRRSLAGAIAAAAGLGLLVLAGFSLAGLAYVPFLGARAAGVWFAENLREAKEAWTNRPAARPELPPEIREPLARYFAPRKVLLSSLAWGLLAAGAAVLARGRFNIPGGRGSAGGPGGGPSGGAGPSWSEKRALARVRRQGHPASGTLLGIEQGTRAAVVVTDAEANQHIFQLGTTGAGKTTTILNFAESALQRGLPLVLIDGKGDPALAAAVEELARTHGRTLKVFAMRGDSSRCGRYDPLAHGNVTELKDKLLYLTEWSEPHYEALAAQYLQLAFRAFRAAGLRPDLVDLVRHLDPGRLAEIVRRVVDRQEQADLLDALDAFQTAEIRGLAARLAVLAESEIGHLFRRKGDVIDLTASIAAGEAVLFSLDSLGFPEYSRLLGRLIVADLKGAAARAYRQRSGMVYCIFDEFNVFASKAVVDLIGKARGAGFCALIATQSLSDIEAAAGAPVVDQIIDNCNTFIIQRQNSPAGAERLAGVIGTRRALEVTRQVEDDWLLGQHPTRMGTVREVREYVVHPDEIKTLRTGEAIVVRKTAGQIQRIWVRNPL